MVQTVRQTTAGLPHNQRFEYWQSTAMTGCSLSARADCADFFFTRDVSSAPHSIAVTTRSAPLRIARTTRHVSRDGNDHIGISSLLSGAGSHMQNGHDETCQPGDLIFCDLARPLDLATTHRHAEARVYIERPVFQARVGRINALAGLVLRRGDPLVDMFVGYLTAYTQSAPRLCDADAEVALDGLLHLLAGLVRNVVGDNKPDQGARLPPAAIQALALAFIEARLDKPGLGVAQIVSELGISRTRLYAAFADAGGVHTAIRDARLKRVRGRLASLADAHRSIEEIARGCGFTDYPSFSRAFRVHFGVSPRDARDAAARAMLAG